PAALCAGGPLPLRVGEQAVGASRRAIVVFAAQPHPAYLGAAFAVGIELSVRAGLCVGEKVRRNTSLSAQDELADRRPRWFSHRSRGLGCRDVGSRGRAGTPIARNA